MASSKPFVSIIVAAYNSDKYIEQCINSLINQTYKNIQIILVDDGSSDNTLKICKDFAKNDKRITIISQKNYGQTKARQAGLRRATGEYCLVFDSDDWLELDAISKCIKAAIKYNADVVTFDGYFNYSQHEVKVLQPIAGGFYDKQRMLDELYPKMLYSGRFYYFGVYAAMWNKLFRRDILVKTLNNVNPSVRIGEDGLTTFSSMFEAKSVCVLKNELLYHYRDNNPSLTRSYVKNQFNSALLLINEYSKINKKYSDVYDLSEQIDYYFMYNIKSIVFEEFYYRYKKSLSSRLSYISTIINHPEVVRVLSKNLNKGLDLNNRIIFWSIRTKITALVVAVIVFYAYKMRFRVTARKLIDRY